jgi:hypothetical protein
MKNLLALALLSMFASNVLCTAVKQTWLDLSPIFLFLPWLR